MPKIKNGPRNTCAAVRGLNELCSVPDNVKNAGLDLRQALPAQMIIRLRLESLQQRRKVPATVEKKEGH